MRYNILGAGVLALSLVAGLGVADVPNFDAQALAASGKAQRYDVALGNGPVRAGGAAVVVAADLSVVRSIITDYAHYASVLPGFTKSRILAKTPNQTDVYLEAPILRGAATLWAVTRFGSVEKEGAGERLEGHKAGQGNVEDLRAVWHLVPVDEHRTLLRLDLLLVPSLPLPAGMITAALEENADDAVSAVRRRAEESIAQTKTAGSL